QMKITGTNLGQLFSGLRGKLLIYFLLLSLIPLVAEIVVVVKKSSEDLVQENIEKLEAIRSVKRHQIESYIKELIQDAEVLSLSTDFINAYEAVKDYYSGKDFSSKESLDITTKDYQKIYDSKSSFLRNCKEKLDYSDILIICRAHGHIMLSAAKGKDLGTNLKYGSYKDTNLAKLMRKVLDSKQAEIVDFEPYSPDDNLPAAFIGSPMLNSDGSIIGVAALRISIDKINAVMQERTGLGDSGETYIVGDDKLLRSNSRFFDGSTILKQKVDTVAVTKSFQGETGIEEFASDYRGVSVLSAYEPLKIKGLNWAIVAQIDETEVKAPVVSFWIILFIIAAVSVL
ncbi:MAG: hypothetical protein GY863_23355, partial [bacterium]|nr:hypothetical protein [bacterium]